METVSIRTPGMSWDIAANIHFPPEFDAARRYPAIMSNHPIGGCKEQTAGNVYGAALAEAGFVVIAMIWPPAIEGLPHDHGTWGVVVVASGEVEITDYRAEELAPLHLHELQRHL